MRVQKLLLYLSILITLSTLVLYQFFKVHYTQSEIYHLKQWRFNEKVLINEATVFVGRNYKGAIEAIILPSDSKTFSYSSNLFGKIKHLYLHFPSEWYELHLKSHLIPIPPEITLQKKAKIIQKNNFRDFPHFLHLRTQKNEKLYCNLSLTNQDIFVSYIDQTSRPMIRDNKGRAILAIDNIWNSYHDDIFQVYYDPSSRMVNILPWWIDERKRALKAACIFLDFEWNFGDIIFFVFDSRIHINNYGIETGTLHPERNHIFTLIDQTPGYHLSKLLASKMNHGKEIESQLIREGLYSLLNQELYDPDEFCRRLINKKDYQLLGENFEKCEYAYPMGASFVNYLIERYGIKIFKQFYGQEKHTEAEAFEFYYLKTGKVLLKEWKDYLNTPDPISKEQR